MADTSAMEADETFARLEVFGLLHREVFLDLDSLASLGDDGGPLNLGDGVRHGRLG
jgi:hypothetical protein